jgi:hypothetical protein
MGMLFCEWWVLMDLQFNGSAGLEFFARLSVSGDEGEVEYYKEEEGFFFFWLQEEEGWTKR